MPLTDVMRLFKDTSDQMEVLETPEESDSENENPVLHNERSDYNPFRQDLTLLVQETLDAANAEAEKAMPVMSQTCPGLPKDISYSLFLMPFFSVKTPIFF